MTNPTLKTVVLKQAHTHEDKPYSSGTRIDVPIPLVDWLARQGVIDDNPSKTSIALPSSKPETSN